VARLARRTGTTWHLPGRFCFCWPQQWGPPRAVRGARLGRDPTVVFLPRPGRARTL